MEKILSKMKNPSQLGAPYGPRPDLNAVDVNLANNYGMTALMYAAQNNFRTLKKLPPTLCAPVEVECLYA